MTPLAPGDTLPLTCTRLGVCCHGHQIWINPWELAVLAAQAGETPAATRARITDCRGLRLAFDGPPDARGKPACRLYDPAAGCTRHPGRPLACRVYPLARTRIDGVVQYLEVRGKLPCLELCPSVTTLPSLTVGDYLASQETAASEIAHDAYAALTYGLVASASALCDHPQAGIDRARVLATLDELAGMDPTQRCQVLPDPWNDLITLGTDGLDRADPAAFVREHGNRLSQAIIRQAQAADAPLVEVACLYVMLGMHLAPVIGADTGAMRHQLGG